MSSNKLYFDTAVASQVLAVIQNAQKHAVLVSPYTKLRTHVFTELKLATEKGKRITLYVRKGEQITDDKDIQILDNRLIDVRVVENLHSKIYMNEDTVIVSSMNLLRSSMEGSLEFAVELGDPSDARMVREYVFERLYKLSTPLHGASGPVYSAASITHGSCIRCRTSISYDTTRPLCEKCYPEWAHWKKKGYEEKFCHSCGKSCTTTYAKPLCDACYQKPV